MKYFLTIAVIAFSFSGFSQNLNEVSESRKQAQLLKSNSINSNSISIKTLNLNLVGVTKNNQGALKDEFLTYEKKVVSLYYDENNETMVIKYTGLSDEKIAFILDNNGVNINAIVNE